MRLVDGLVSGAVAAYQDAVAEESGRNPTEGKKPISINLVVVHDGHYVVHV